jgi:hypothetical protein
LNIYTTANAATSAKVNGARTSVEVAQIHLFTTTPGPIIQARWGIADEFGVTVLSAGGFNSVTEKRALGIEMAETEKLNLIWHIGDYDPSGVHVFQSLAEDVAAFAEAEGSEVSFQRLAVTPDQIEEYRLPMSPTKSTDARAFDGTGTVQAEAIDPVKLQRLLRDALSGYFDDAIADTVRARSADWADRLVEVWK